MHIVFRTKQTRIRLHQQFLPSYVLLSYSFSAAVLGRGTGGSMGRRKIEMKRIADESARNICFSKRRRGLFKKADAFARDFGAAVAVVACTPHGNAYAYGSPSAESVMRRFVLHHEGMHSGRELAEAGVVDSAGGAEEAEVVESGRFWWNGAAVDGMTAAEARKVREDLLELKRKIQDRLAATPC